MVASRDADGGRAHEEQARERAYFFLVAFFFVAFFTVFFGAVFTAFFFAALAAIAVDPCETCPFEMLSGGALTTQAQQNDAERAFSCDESRNGPNRHRATSNFLTKCATYCACHISVYAASPHTVFARLCTAQCVRLRK